MAGPSTRPAHLRQVPEHVARALQRLGTPLDLAHERTARARLTYDWDYAKVIKPPPEGITVAPVRPRALPLADAVTSVVSGDRRPFLIVRECWQCGGGDESAIGRKLANEKTILFAKWFRCVRVSDAVRHPDHPLHAIFAGHHAPHMVLGNADNSEIIPIDSDLPLSGLWSAMRGLIAQAYDGDAEAAMNQQLQILSSYDHLDNLEKELATRLDNLLLASRTDAAQVVAVRTQLASVASKRQELEGRETKVMDLSLRATPRRG